jgi:hypothetical protein
VEGPGWIAPACAVVAAPAFVHLEPMLSLLREGVAGLFHLLLGLVGDGAITGAARSGVGRARRIGEVAGNFVI